MNSETVVSIQNIQKSIQTISISGDYGRMNGTESCLQLGALLFLETHHLLSNVTRMVGSSTGALLAFLLSLRIPCLVIFSFLQQWNQDKRSMRSGMLADTLAEWLDHHSPSLSLITFEQIKKAFGVELILLATDVDEQSAAIFSPNTHPALSVLEVVCATLQNPLLTTPLYHVSTILGKNYVDGSWTCNHPMAIASKWLDNIDEKKKDKEEEKKKEIGDEDEIFSIELYSPLAVNSAEYASKTTNRMDIKEIRDTKERVCLQRHPTLQYPDWISFTTMLQVPPRQCSGVFLVHPRGQTSQQLDTFTMSDQLCMLLYSGFVQCRNVING